MQEEEQSHDKKGKMRGRPKKPETPEPEPEKKVEEVKPPVVVEKKPDPPAVDPELERLKREALAAAELARK